jgi:hypothetical protein
VCQKIQTATKAHCCSCLAGGKSKRFPITGVIGGPGGRDASRLDSLSNFTRAHAKPNNEKIGRSPGTSEPGDNWPFADSTF